ncbi:hypothetical protein [Staphylococcus epidermidis]|nr:hypothetical protein [Staphylococcus epidermidis]
MEKGYGDKEVGEMGVGKGRMEVEGGLEKLGLEDRVGLLGLEK